MSRRASTTNSPRYSKISAFLLTGGLLASPVFANSDEYDSLILRAREGDTTPALSMLRNLDPVEHIQQRYDHLLIASWAGEAVETIQVYQSLPHAQVRAPADVHLAAARAYRDLGQWSDALNILEAEHTRHLEKQTDFAALRIMTLTDAGQLDSAYTAALDWVKRQPDNVDLRLAMAYVCTRKQQPFDALHHTDTALKLAPQQPWVQREYAFALQHAGLAGPALEWAQKHPGLLNAAQLRALEGDVLALQTRIADTPSRNEAERFLVADRALARYDSLIPAWQALGDEAAADVIRLRIDRLSALHARSRMYELIQEYEQLRNENITLPIWALSDVASAYLYLRQPEKARDLYQQVLHAFAAAQADPAAPSRVDAGDQLDNEVGLFYSLIEGEQFDQVPALLERLQSRHGPWLWITGQPERLPNEYWLEAQQTLAMASLLGNDTPAAQAKLEALTFAAPQNSNLHAELAGVYRARGWPRQAEIQLKLAETLAPRSLPVENGQGFVALDLHEWRQVEELSADTITRQPEHLNSQRLARMWEVHNKAELQVNINRGLASDSPVTGSGDLSIDSTLYSAPLGYNWRMFSGLGHASGKYQEGKGHHNWQHAGIEWRSRDLWLEWEISNHRYGAGNKPGARLAARYDLGDQLQIGARLERISPQTPLRALRSGIFANVMQADLVWRTSDHREWNFSLSPMRFSDGNQRWAVDVNGVQRLRSAPHHNVDFMLEAAAQHNSQGGIGPYYNPHRDLIVLPGVRLTHILHRHYETVWEHLASVSAGSYSQQGEGTGGALSLNYGQRFRYNDVLEIGGHINAISRPYDGRRENELRISLDLNLRF